MAGDYDDSDDSPISALTGTNQQWVSVLVPIAIVLGLGVIAVGYTIIRRRRNRRAAAVLYLNSRAARLSDIEEGRGRGRQYPIYHLRSSRPVRGRAGDGASGTVVYTTRGGGRVVRTANRWAWVGHAAAAVSSRRGDQEGLNELGEAPPPYERPGSNRKEDGSRAVVGEELPIPLENLSERTVAGAPPPAADRPDGIVSAPNRTGMTVAVVNRAADGHGNGSPPAYSESRLAEGGATGDEESISRPQPAALPPEEGSVRFS